MINAVSSLLLPTVLAAVCLIIFFRGDGAMDAFSDGAVSGLKTSVSLIPTMILLMIAVNMVRVSGISDALSSLLAPAAKKIGIPSELIPLLFLRPFSGSASNAMLSDIFDTYGADSLAGITASIIYGSSETMIYVICIYLGSAKVKKSRYTIPCAIAVTIFSVLLSCALGRIAFGASAKP